MITEVRRRSENPSYRWVTLGVLLLATAIVILDNTVLQVAVPTLLRDFHTSLPSLQWVLSGYALTFATLLIIGGKLGDVYGARRMFMIGLGIFGLGSFIAAISNGVGEMVLGEAIIEGIGASLLLPSATGIMTRQFRGPERAMAFALWGSVVGAAGAFGPLVGGYLTTYHSWRWAFGINVVLAPIAIAAALVLMPRDEPGRRVGLDVMGAVLVAISSFCTVFAFSQGPTYGWWKPLRAFTVNGADLWPADRAVSVIPLMLVAAAAFGWVLVTYERRREARDGDALFPLSQLHLRGFRNGMLTALIFTMGTFGFMFVLPVFLQEGKHLSAAQAGEWLVTSGIAMLVGSQIAGRVTGSLGPVVVVRIGMLLSAVATFALMVVLSPTVTFVQLLPVMVLCGFGAGFANTQLTNVILFDVDSAHASVAAGSSSTLRQLGAGMGIAVIGTVLSTSTRRAALSVVRDAPMSAGARASLTHDIRTRGLGVLGEGHLPPALLRSLEQAVAHGTRPALFVAGLVLLASQIPAARIPRQTRYPSAARLDEEHPGLKEIVAAEVP
jgi:EmrB/QacA subfamily drug resistance transporter